MNAIEIEAPIIDHQITICSDRLPAQMSRAKIIVLFDAVEQAPPSQRRACQSARKPCTTQRRWPTHDPRGTV